MFVRYLDRDTYLPERMSCRSCSTNRYLCVGKDGQEVIHTGQEYKQSTGVSQAFPHL